MSLIIYPEGQSPKLPEYKFYDNTETLRFDKSTWIYYRKIGEEWVPQDGVTTVLHEVIDKSFALMPWAVKLALTRLKSLLVQRGHLGPDGAPLLEPTLDEIIEVAKKADKDALHEAGDLGTAAHDWIETYIKAVISGNENRRYELLSILPVDERSANACIAACLWMSAHNVRWLFTERKIFSRTHGYAGTADGFALVDSCTDINCCSTAFKDQYTLIDWKTSRYLHLEYLLQTAAYVTAYTEEMGREIAARWIIRLGKEDAAFDPWYVPGNESLAQDFNGFLQALTLYRTIKTLESRIGAIKEKRVATKKALAKEQQDALYLICCPASKTYKGRKKKGCNGTDKLCKACEEIYETRYSKAVVG